MAQEAGTTRVDCGALRDLLERAVVSHSRVHLRESNTNDGPTASGFLAGRDGETLIIEIQQVSPVDAPFRVGMPLQVGLEVGDDRYVFETQSITGLSAGSTGSLRLVTPLSARREERRRSPRRRLKAPADVVLHGNRVQATWRCRAALLNLSADGLACKVSDDDAGELSVGRTVCVMFRPAETAGGFDLEARVSNLTEAGTPEAWIVGLEFLHDTTPPGSRARLQEVLNG